MTRNVILVTIDSLRADHCGFMGYERDTTPTLDQMAKDGLVFDTAIAPGPATPESVPVSMTGEFPTSSVDSQEPSELVRYRRRIRKHMMTRETVAEQFSRAGYTTGAFTPNPFTSRHFGFDRGFDYFEDFMESRSGDKLYRTVFNRFLRGEGIANTGRAVLNRLGREEVFKPWESFYDDVVNWVRQRDGPYFLWLFLMDVHNPYLATREYRTQSWFDSFRANLEFWRQSHETPFSPSIHDKLIRGYDDAIRYADACLAQLRDDLPDPLLVVHADHGEAFGEHGTYGHEPYLYEENVHVPLVVENGPQGRVAHPTGLRMLPDLLTTLQGDPTDIPEPSNVAVTRTERGKKTATRGTYWKYISSADRDVLYDLRKDEQTNRRTELPELATEARRLTQRAQEADAERGRITRAAQGVDP